MTVKARIPLFDLWRILGVALVIGVHLLQRFDHPFGNAFGLPGIYYVTLGGLGVTFLIVLSGAVLEYNHPDPRAYAFTFLRRRFARIYPVYWMSMAVTPLIMGFEAARGHGADVVSWILDAAGLFAFTGRPWTDMVLPTGWFIGVIFTLYLLFPWLSAAMRSRPGITLAVLLAVSLLSRVLLYRYWPTSRAADWFTFARVFEFGLGIALMRSAWVVGWLQRRMASWPEGVLRVMAHLSLLSFPAYLIHYAVQRSPMLAGLESTQYLLAYFVTLWIAVEALNLADTQVQRVLRRSRRSPSPR